MILLPLRCRILYGLALLVAVVVVPAAAWGEARLATVFADHMVLQRGRAVPVWGTAAAGEQVSVSIGKRTGSTKADAAGRWKVMLEAMPAGGPHQLVIRATNTLKVSDVLVGDRDLVALRSREITTRPLVTLEDGSRATWKSINIVLPALLVLGYGFLQWRAERNRTRRLEELYG